MGTGEKERQKGRLRKRLRDGSCYLEMQNNVLVCCKESGDKRKKGSVEAEKLLSLVVAIRSEGQVGALRNKTSREEDFITPKSH